MAMTVRTIIAVSLATLLAGASPATAQSSAPPPTGQTDDEKIAAGEMLPPGYVPPSADPHDIEGVWMPGTVPGAVEEPPPPEDGRGEASGTSLQCTPVSQLEGAKGSASDLWVQDSHMILMVSESGMDVRQIYLNGTHPADFRPQPNGHSIGHWEGDTLVVDTIGFSDASGRDIGQHVVERIRKVPLGKFTALRHDFVITQNGKMRTMATVENYRPDLNVYENICEETFGRFLIVNGVIVTPNDDPRENDK